MELPSTVSGNELKAMDNSTIRSFVKKQILEERALNHVRPSPATQPAANAADVIGPMPHANLAAAIFRLEKDRRPLGPYVGPGRGDVRTGLLTRTGSECESNGEQGSRW